MVRLAPLVLEQVEVPLALEQDQPFGSGGSHRELIVMVSPGLNDFAAGEVRWTVTG